MTYQQTKHLKAWVTMSLIKLRKFVKNLMNWIKRKKEQGTNF